MNRQVSLRLDALRAAGALLVFAGHVSYLTYGDTEHDFFVAMARIGVLIFFVMSGYVIAYVTEHKHRHLGHYMNARLARLFSVFIPALLLTLACDALGRQFRAGLYAGFPEIFSTRPLLYFPFFITFTFENSWFSLRWMSNGPMWSIAYEFWYYVIYGVLFYTKGKRRIFFTALAMFAAGWKILLLAPVWFAGVLLYRHGSGIAARLQGIRRPLLVLSVLALFLLCLPYPRALLAPLGEFGVRHFGLWRSSSFLADYVYCGVVVVLMIALVSAPDSRPAPGVERAVTAAANFSFSLYLFHVPLLFLFRSTGLYDPASLPQSLIAAGLALLCCYLLATVTEHRKKTWLSLVNAAFSAITARNGRTNENA